MCLYLYGIDAVPVEEMKRKILFELLVQRLDRPSESVDFKNVLYRKLKVVGQ